MSAPDGRRELLDAPDGTSPPMPVQSPLVPIGAALESLHRKADFIIAMGSFLVATVMFAIVFFAFRPSGVLETALCGAAAGLSWHLILGQSRKI